MRYYNTQDHNIAFPEDGDDIPGHLIQENDPRVSEYFKPLPDGKMLEIDDAGLPHIVDAPSPTPVNPQDTINAEHRQYLLSTDWMAIRAADGGKAVPADVAAKRIAARAAIVD